MVPTPDTNIISTFAWLELLVSDVHLLGTEWAGMVSIIAHGSTELMLQVAIHPPI